MEQSTHYLTQELGGNPLSFKGKSGRLNFIVYGAVLSFLIYVGAMFFAVHYKADEVMALGLILSLWIGTAAIVRRARDLQENPLVTVIAAFLIWPIAVLYLSLRGGKKPQPQEVNTFNE